MAALKRFRERIQQALAADSPTLEPTEKASRSWLARLPNAVVPLRTDLCGGRSAMIVPTATLNPVAEYAEYRAVTELKRFICRAQDPLTAVRGW